MRGSETRARTRPLPVVALVLVGAALFGVGFVVGSRTAGPAEPRREFAFQVLGLPTTNQGGNTLNLYFRYRYAPGLAEAELPDYGRIRNDAVGFLATADLSRNPYRETLNSGLCRRLKDGYPLAGISCQLQVVADDHGGYRSSVETLGDEQPLDIPAPPGAR